MHTARIWMALAIPGGAPGYDDDKQFGNFITHMAPILPKGCAVIAIRPQKSREGGAWRDLGRLTGFRAFFYCHSGARVKRASPESRDSGSGPSDHPGMTLLSHPLATSGFTHSNSGS